MEEEEKRFDLTSCFARLLRRGFELTPRRERRDVFLRLAPTQVGFERKEKNINTSGELLAKCGAARIGNSFGIWRGIFLLVIDKLCRGRDEVLEHSHR